MTLCMGDKQRWLQIHEKLKHIQILLIFLQAATNEVRPKPDNFLLLASPPLDTLSAGSNDFICLHSIL